MDMHGGRHDHDEHGDSESGSIAVRSAFIHVIGDALQSFGVMIAAGDLVQSRLATGRSHLFFVFGLIVLATTPEFYKL